MHISMQQENGAQRRPHLLEFLERLQRKGQLDVYGLEQSDELLQIQRTKLFARRKTQQVGQMLRLRVLP